MTLNCSAFTFTRLLDLAVYRVNEAALFSYLDSLGVQFNGVERTVEEFKKINLELDPSLEGEIAQIGV